MEIVEVCGRKPELIPALLTVWENSVRATHLFLSEAEIAKIKEYVPQALAEAEHLVIAENEEKEPVAFMGTKKDRLEMLFLLPSERGKGLGKCLVRHGIRYYGIREVTVNEQNPQAVGFYQHMDLKPIREPIMMKKEIRIRFYTCGERKKRVIFMSPNASFKR